MLTLQQHSIQVEDGFGDCFSAFGCRSEYRWLCLFSASYWNKYFLLAIEENSITWPLTKATDVLLFNKGTENSISHDGGHVLLNILSRFYPSHELRWRLKIRMIAIFIIMYPITNTVFSPPNLFQLCSESEHCFCQTAIMSPFCSFAFLLSIAWIWLTWVTKLQKPGRKKQRRQR